jgi:hypothetical protein
MSNNIAAIIGAQAAQYYQPSANNRPTDAIRRQTFAGVLPNSKNTSSNAGGSVFSSPVSPAGGGNFTKQFFG